jgi:hypothetical protein
VPEKLLACHDGSSNESILSVAILAPCSGAAKHSRFSGVTRYFYSVSLGGCARDPFSGLDYRPILWTQLIDLFVPLFVVAQAGRHEVPVARLPGGRVIALACHNRDIAEYYEWSCALCVPRPPHILPPYARTPGACRLSRRSVETAG